MIQTPEPLPPSPTPALYPQQAVAAVVLAVVILLVVFELVRKRKLREEYSLLWAVTALGLLVLAWQPHLLGWFARLIDAREANSALFFGGLLFLMLVSLQFSVRLSKLTFRNRKLTQRVALLERELREMQERTPSPGENPGAPQASPES